MLIHKSRGQDHNVAPKLAVEEGFHGAESVCLSFVIEDDSRPSTFYLNPSSILHSQTLYTACW